MVNRTNFLAARNYLRYLDEVNQLNERSIRRYWFYLKYVLLWADETLLCQAAGVRPTFASYLADECLDDAKEPLAPATLKKIIQTAKRFFLWAKMTYPHNYRGLSAAWIDTLRPPRGVQAVVEHEFITLEEVRQLAALQIDEADLALVRDRAAAALLFLSGMRVGALSTLPIGAVDLKRRTIKQLTALGVKTKNGKSATTYLLDIPELLAIVEQWDVFVRTRLPATAMWYTPLVSHWGEQALSSNLPGSNRNVAIARRMRHLFKVAGLPYKSPHKFRHGHAVYALQHAKTMADYKAVSMNLMHEDIRVTDGIYAPLASNEVQQRITGLTGQPMTSAPVNADLSALLQTLSKEQLSQAVIAIVQRMAS